MICENAFFFLFFLEGGNDVVDNDGGDVFDDVEDVLHTDGGDDVDPHVHACDSIIDFSIFLKQIGHVTVSCLFLFGTSTSPKHCAA